MCYHSGMPHEVIITTKDLRIVSASRGVEALCGGCGYDPGCLLTERLGFLMPLFEGKDVFLDGLRASLVETEDHYVIVLSGATDKREAGSMLYGDAGLLETIVEDAPVGIILTDDKGRIEYLNRKQEQNSRRRREDLYMRDIRDVYRKTYGHPEVVKMYDSLLAGEDPSRRVIVDHYNPQFYRRDMTIKFQAKRLVGYGKIAIFVEIEDELYRQKRKAEKAGEELRLSRTYLTRLLDASPNMVISIDDKRNILSFNKTAERLLGCRAEETYGTRVDRFFPREELPKLQLAVEARVPWFGAAHLIHIDGTGFPVELSSTKIVDEMTGREIATLLLAVDIRERDRLRKNLMQSQKMTFVGELVSGLAHQLNNPLVGVVNIAEVLMQAMEKDDPRLEYARMIKEAGEHCREVIARLLRFSRKRETFMQGDVDIQVVLNAGIELLARHPRFGDVMVEREFTAVPAVGGDPVLLQQAFMNILMNSAQALDGDGVIRVSCSFQGGSTPQVEVVITDNGSGIAEKDLPRIFEPFFSTKDDEEGTGIGLSLAYWIIQDHGGRIGVDSAIGKGTSFTVVLPAKDWTGHGRA